MSQKKEAPVRPPRTRLERLIAKKPPATSDLTIRFNALSDEDNFEDELAILVNNAPEDNPLDPPANIPNSEIIAIKEQKLNKRSTSLDNKESTETWSIFSDLRGKITKTLEDNWEHYRNNKEKKDGSKELTLRLRKFDSLPETNLEDQFKLNSEIDGDIVGDQNESLLNELFAAELPHTPKSTNQSLVSHLSFDSMNKKKKTQPVSMTLSSLLASTSEAETQADEIAEEAEEADVFICGPVNSNISTPVIERSEVPVRQKKEMFSDFLMTKSMWIGVLAIFIYLIIPLPSYLSGMIMGSFITFSIGFFFLWLFKPAPPKEFQSPKQVPTIKECSPEGGIYKGWMNELPTEYNPDDYHINQTHSIYVRLEGSTLRLSRPKNNIPKRAMWDEPRYESSFVHQRHFEIKASTLILLPVELSKKRLWSKKYPICIHLAKNSTRIFQKFTGQGSSDKEDESNNSSKSVSIETKDISDEKLYLFARTCREKEEWFRRLQVAIKGIDCIKSFEMSQSANNLSSQISKPTLPLKDIKPHTRTSSTDSSSSNVSTPEESKSLKPADMLDFQRFMSQIIPSSSTKQQVLTMKKDKEKIKDSETFDPNSNSTTWLNALLFRIFWDSLTDRLLADFIRDKIQRKLEKIKVPYFMDELTVTDIDMGVGIPIIQHVSPPAMDYRGLWIDFEITYVGSFRMTLETKLNLMRLKKIDLDKTTEKELEVLNASKPYVANSEAEDSAESSSDEEVGPETTSADHYSAHNVGGGSTSKKILRFVDKIAQSKYFQLATEYKYFKRAMEGVSNTRLILTMEVHQLIGTLVINIPPPPTDRLWYGFRGNPQMLLSAKPKFGEREVSITHVTEWIEKKLHQEFQKIFVMPNMDDLIIPIMLSGLE